MSTFTRDCPALPNEVWVDILRHLSLDTLWYSTRPICSLFYHVSTALVKSALVDGSSCELRHYISFRDPLLLERLHYPTEHSEYQRRILQQEGHSPFSQVLLWSSSSPSRANPQYGPGIPTVNYESADGKKCVTMAVFGQQDQTSTSSSRTFHCRRTGCMILEDESVSDGHVCLAGCWHVHYSRTDKLFCATIPLSLLLPIYLRLEMARREKGADRSYLLERKGRWSTGSRHGVSASVSPVNELDDMIDNILGVNQNGAVTDEGEEEPPETIMEWSEDEQGYLNGSFDLGVQMEVDG